jgi:hypothetical protein
MKDVLDVFGDLPDFPGKKQPKNRPEAQLQSSILIDRYNGAKGKDYVINGVTQTFYSIGEVSKALGKKPVTLRMWERKGWIPKTSFRTPTPKSEQIPGKVLKGRRLYSQEQLDTLIDGVERFGILEYYSGDWDGFIKYIKDNWKR